MSYLAGLRFGQPHFDRIVHTIGFNDEFAVENTERNESAASGRGKFDDPLAGGRMLIGHRVQDDIHDISLRHENLLLCDFAKGLGTDKMPKEPLLASLGASLKFRKHNSNKL